MALRPPVPLLVLVFVVPALAGCIGETGDRVQEGPAAAAGTGNATVVPDRFDGKLVCGLGGPQGTMNPCAVTKDSHNVFPFKVSSGLETLIVGVRWSPTTTAGESLEVLVESADYSVFGYRTGYRYAQETGTPDLVVRIDDGGIEDQDRRWSNVSGSLDLQVRVFPGRTMPPSAVVDQAFEVHVVRYYGAPAAPDANPFLVTGDDAGRSS